MSGPEPPPPGFAIGHWTDREGMTGCTAVITPPATRGAVDVSGGGPGTRETEVIGALAGRGEVGAVMLTGGSAFGLGSADGAMRWLERHGRGSPTPAGPVPIVPAAVIYDLAEGDPAARPDAAAGEAACEVAAGGVPERGAVGAGTGAAVGKLGGRASAMRAGVGYASARTGSGARIAALAVVNAFGDVIGEGGEILAGTTDGAEPRSSAARIAALEAEPDWSQVEERNTTLVCVMTDAPLDRRACARVARMASGGVARAVDPVFSDVDGDVAFCLASGTPPSTDRFLALTVGTVAATVTAAAIRDSVAGA